jgi:hypothetical protein
MAAAGRWWVTPTAIHQYCELTGRRDDESTLAEMIDVCEKAHHVRSQENGLDLYRGPRPLRLRLLVAPARRSDELPQLVQVLTSSPRGRAAEGAGSRARRKVKVRR